VARPVRVALLASFVLAGSALAGDDGFTLKLLPQAKKGLAEEIGYQVTVAYSGESEELKGTMRREIKAVSDDGLPSSEQIEVLSADYSHRQENSSYGTSSSGNGAKTVKRNTKSRMASLDLVDLSHVTFKHVGDVVAAMRRDPDGLARAIQPDEPMKVDDRWEVEPRDLVWLLVGTKTKVQEGSKATATLESVKKKEGVPEAVITLKAKIDFTKNDDPDTVCRLVVEAQLRGPIDGSAPPRKEHLSFTVREGESKKVTQTVELERNLAEKDDDDSKEDDSKEKKKPKKDAEKKKEKEKEEEK
jgi:hypothetical protein